MDCFLKKGHQQIQNRVVEKHERWMIEMEQLNARQIVYSGRFSPDRTKEQVALMTPEEKAYYMIQLLLGL
jgi:hypothetical protein